MHKYEIIIYWSNDDDAFVSEVPQLPGCMAHGATQESALTNVREAIDLWLETAKERFRSPRVEDFNSHSRAQSNPEFERTAQSLR